ncbi:XRE family transcriptional regulator [Paenibacillus albicereus]|uniref:XRE family transcriptional regulator n=1 Tax=Paenibacillus albicereus TaxID=2726185 RepID=A0A6H2H1P6_9BACL|nr:DUF5680 domain-containing protein [Paenibacillus albicereus]QJC53614.1 XRE family transcriptional regulator [Paenibacillus albicereus]
MTADPTPLARFLHEAKTRAYAAGGAPAAPSRPGSKDYPYEQVEFRYLDSYVGELDFAGQEIVWRSGEAVWAMNYYGHTLVPEPDFPEFLLEALRAAPAEAPLRGPALFESDRFRYACSWEGGLDRFEGREEIVRTDGTPIFRLVFHGGAIRREP